MFCCVEGSLKENLAGSGTPCFYLLILHAAVEPYVLLLVASGAGDRLIGITDMCDRPPGVKTRRQVVSCACFLQCLFST